MSQTYLSTRLPEALAFLKDLVNRNSFSGNGDGVEANALRIIEQFSDLNFTVTRVQCDLPGTGEHLVLDSGGTGAVIACISHLDTVFSEAEEREKDFGWQQEDDRIFGPGTIDNKGGTAMLWMVMDAMAHLSPKEFGDTRWILIWNAAEEVGGSNFASFLRAFLPDSTRCCLVFEADNSPEDGGFSVVNGRKGLRKYHLAVEGRSAHAGNQHRTGASAIRQLARIVEAAESLTNYDEDILVNVGTIQGGSATNRVPEFAEARLEVRMSDNATSGAMDCRLLKIASEAPVAASSDGFACRVTISPEDPIPCWAASDGTQELVSVWKEAAQTFGLDSTAGQRGGYSDANFVWDLFPTLDGLGPRGANFHVSTRAPDGSQLPEFVELSSFVPKACINLEAMRLLLQPR